MWGLGSSPEKMEVRRCVLGCVEPLLKHFTRD